MDRELDVVHTHPDKTGPSDQDWTALGWGHVKTVTAYTTDGKQHKIVKPIDADWSKSTPRMIRDAWGEIEDEIFNSGRSRTMTTEQIVTEINERMAARFGFEYTVTDAPETRLMPTPSPLTLRPDGTLAGAEEVRREGPAAKAAVREPQPRPLERTGQVSADPIDIRTAAEEVSRDAEAARMEGKRGAITLGTINRPAGILRRATEHFVSFFRTFGTAYVSDKKLARRLDQSFAGLSTATERGVDAVHKVLVKTGDRSEAIGIETTFALEEAPSRDSVSPEARPLYDAMKEFRDKVTKIEKQSGVLGEGFPASARRRITEKIVELQNKERPGANDARLLDELEGDLVALDKIKGYMPHAVVAKRYMEMAFEERDHAGRVELARNLEAFHKQRKGTATLREYYKAGILKPADLDVGALMMRMSVDANKKIVLKSLGDYGLREGYIVTSPTKPGEEYISMANIGKGGKIMLPQFIGQKPENIWVHRLFADGMEYLNGSKSGKSAGPILGFYDKIVGQTKSAQFFNPSLIWAYNIMQRGYGGAYELNPIKSARNTRDAFESVLTKDENYQRVLEYGAFQEPSLGTRTTDDQRIELFARQTRSDLSSSKMINTATKTLERVMGKTYSLKTTAGAKDFAVDAILLAPLYRSIANLTWTGDRVQRMHTWYNLTRQGWGEREAAEQVARIHGAYSKFSGTGYKAIGKRILFVHSFRLLMPLQTIRAYTTPVKLALDALTGKDVPMYKVRTATKALIGTIAIPSIIDAMLQGWGWTPTEEEESNPILSKLRTKIPGTNARIIWALPNWKYKKDFVNDKGKTRTVVLGINNIANMGTKWLIRATPPPEKLDNTSAAMLNLVKWEVNPFFRVVADLWANDASFGEPPPRGADGKDWVAGVSYAYRNIFRLAGAIYNKVQRAEGKQRPYEKQQEDELKQSLSYVEQIIAGTKPGEGIFGYAYTRSEKHKRVKYMATALQREVSAMKHTIEKTSPDPADAQIITARLDKLFEDRIGIMARKYNIPVSLLIRQTKRPRTPGRPQRPKPGGRD